MQILLVRHGESEGNAAQRVQGLRDEALTPIGRQQAAALAVRLCNGYCVDSVYSSPLRRALDTACTIADALNLPVICDDRLKEYDCGLIAGMTFEELGVAYPEVARRWREDEQRAALPGEEGLEGFVQRVTGAMKEISLAHADRAEVVVVTHGGVLSNYLSGLLRLDLAKRQPWTFDNASLSIVDFGGQFPRIVLLNDTGHLQSWRPQ